jgi:hypothetical protein
MEAIMQKIVILTLALILALSLAACGGGNGNSDNNGASDPHSDSGASAQLENNGGNQSVNTATGGEWPKNDFTKLVPKPTVGVINPLDLDVMMDSSRCIVDMKWTVDEARAYAEEVKAAGFSAVGDVIDEADYDYYGISTFDYYYECNLKNEDSGYYALVQYSKNDSGLEDGYITISNFNIKE